MDAFIIFSFVLSLLSSVVVLYLYREFLVIKKVAALAATRFEDTNV